MKKNFNLPWSNSSLITARSKALRSEAVTKFTGSPQSGNRMKEVLIIDDEEDITLNLKNIVGKNLECNTRRAHSFAEGAALLQSEYKPDVVFIDINLGDGVGYDLLPIVYALPNPPKVVMMSAYRFEREVNHNLQINYFLQKPFTAEQVMTMLKNV